MRPDGVATSPSCGLITCWGHSLIQRRHWYREQNGPRSRKFVSSEYLQKVRCKGSVALLCKMDSIISKGNIPFPGIGKADTKLLGKSAATPCKSAGMVNQLLTGHPLPRSHGRRYDQQNLIRFQRQLGEDVLQFAGSLLRTASLEQIVGTQHENQQVGVRWKVRR